jgi:cellulose synthase/poly-beta-1,6-N-acetylglucosamine synthase-like glycosyltransferase
MHEVYSVIVFAAVLALALPATLACIYLLALTSISQRAVPPAPASRRPFFDVIVPAHNEAGGVAATVSSLLRLDWPADRFRVVVVADNCTDATAARAREAGAAVVERLDPVKRGKGYALEYVFRWSRAQGRADAVAVVDADSTASANLLQSFAARMERGAVALQAHYGVLNANASWRTRLMSIALGAIHKLRSRARERLGLSCGIRGNGWCVTHALLDEVPYQAYSLTEDVEFGVHLGLAGHRVAYCDEASVDGEMVTTERAARSQRQRWEGGRFKLIRDQVPTLMRAAVSRRSLVCLDLAMDLLVLPLSYIVLNVAGIVAIGALIGTSARPLLWLGVADALALIVYVCRGWMLSGIGIAGFWDLLRVPVFLFWKVVLIFSGQKATTWIRTKREKS